MSNSDIMEHSLELPGTSAPEGDAQQAASASPEAPPVSGFEASTAPSSGGPAPQDDASAQLGQSLAPVPPAPAPQATVPTAPPMQASLTAGDQELIEKVWVEKAKEIVARTHGDPYSQNKEINKIRADYIKKRYNKDIKLGAE